MTRQPTKQAHDRFKIRRYASKLLVATLLCGLNAAIAADEPQPAANGTSPVEVRLTEYRIEMPQSLPAGPTTFLLRNEGKKNHRFAITGPSGEETTSATVRPHATANVEVALKPGEYKVYCPLGSHAVKGMSMTLVVAARPQG